MPESYSVQAILTAKDRSLVATIDKAVSAVEKLTKSIDSVGELVLKAKDQATQPMEKVTTAAKKLSDTTAEPVIEAKDKASDTISQAKSELQKLSNEEAKPEITAQDRISEMLATAKSGLESLSSMVAKPVIDANDNPIMQKISGVKEKLSEITKGIFQGVGHGIFDSFTDGLNDVKQSMNDGELAWKSFEGNMRIAKMPTKQINETREALSQYAAQTIYDASDMASTFSQLYAVGTKDSLGLVKALAGLASSATDPKQAMRSLSMQATQMAGKSKVAYMDYKILAQQAPVAMKKVADSMGMTMGEMTKQISAGQMSTQKFFDAMNKVGNSSGFQDMSDHFFTVEQAADGLKETIADKLLPIYDQLGSVGIAALTKVTNAIEDINMTPISNGITRVVNGLRSMWNVFKSTGALNAVKSAFSSLASSISSVIGKIHIGKIATMAAQAFGNLIKILSTVIAKLSQFGGPVAGVVAAIGTVLAAVKGLNVIKSLNPFALFGRLAKGGISQAIQAVTGGKSRIQGIIGSLGNGIKAGLEGVADVAKGIGSAIESAFTGLAAVLSTANPANLLALGGAIGIVCAGLALMGTVGPGVAQIIASIGTAVGNTAPAIQALGAGLGDVAAGIGQGIGAILASIAPEISSLGPVISAVGQNFNNLASIVTNAVTNIIASLAPYIPNINSMVGATSAAIQAVCNSFNTLVGQIVPVLNTLNQSISTIFSGIEGTLNGFAGIVSGALSGVSNIFMGLGQGIRTAFDGLADIINSVGDACMKAGVGFDLISVAVTRLSQAGFASIGGSLVAAAGGITAIGLAASGAAGGARQLSTIATSLQQIPGSAYGAAASLSSVSAAISSVAASVPSISGAFTGMSASVSGAVNACTSVVVSGGSRMANAMRNAGNMMVNGLRSGAMQMPAAIQSGLSSMFGILAGAAGRAYSSGSMIGAGLANGIRSMVGAVAAAADALAYQAARAINARARIHSPSRVTMESGQYFGQGFANGITNMQGRVQNAVDDMYELLSVDDPKLLFDGLSMHSQQEYATQLTVTGTAIMNIDSREFARAMWEPLEKEKQSNTKVREKIGY